MEMLAAVTELISWQKGLGRRDKENQREDAAKTLDRPAQGQACCGLGSWCLEPSERPQQAFHFESGLSS
ncbi:hypothetical protein I79_003613 [Cricetulus griseus]|uniref:Uncharacterized protein n=1 Tax=Cricetulus griseus TaxID=10029 RepID=G3H0F8_CRIGR|nr:hypothetical protein I79_003613 [Cricetulus griseus]